MDETKTGEATKAGGNNWSVPIAIVLAGVMIAGALYFKTPAPTGGQVAAVGDLNKMAKISASDHTRGSLKAPIKIVEYSDLECPFCKAFDGAMKQVLTKHNATSTSVAWIYRHFPLDSIHSKARKEAEAVECAYEQTGNDGFWKFTDKIFSVTPSNNGLDLALLPAFAKELGLDEAKFNTCLTSGKMAEKIEANYQNGIAIGVDGTPTVIVVMENGKMFMPFKEKVPTKATEQVKTLTADIFTLYQDEITKLRGNN